MNAFATEPLCGKLSQSSSESGGYRIFAVQEVLTPDDARTLLALCESGKLHDVEKWIASGKSLRVPPELKKTPLGVALETRIS